MNLDVEAKWWLGKRGISASAPNPLLDPAVCKEFVRDVARKYSAGWTWGGYLEDRTFLWRGTYLDQLEGVLHVGIDVNVPAGTVVRAGICGQVLHCDDDTPELHGWGPRVFIQPFTRPEWVLIYAHLANVCTSPGEKVSVESQIGVVGSPPHNGNWYSHLHIQAAALQFFQTQRARAFVELDGYIARQRRQEYVQIFYDPVSVLSSARAAESQ